MSRFVRGSARVYRGLLVLYPFELRFEFGEEMTGVFADDLAEAWQSGCISAVLGVWWRAASEVFQIALPGRIANQALVAPAVSVALHLAALGGVLILATLARDAVPQGVLHGLVTLRIDRPIGQ